MTIQRKCDADVRAPRRQMQTPERVAKPFLRARRGAQPVPGSLRPSSPPPFPLPPPGCCRARARELVRASKSAGSHDPAAAPGVGGRRPRRSPRPSLFRLARKASLLSKPRQSWFASTSRPVRLLASLPRGVRASRGAAAPPSARQPPASGRPVAPASFPRGALRGGRRVARFCTGMPSFRLLTRSPVSFPSLADRQHVLELGSGATVADVKAAIEARQGACRRRGAGCRGHSRGERCR